MGTSRKLKLDLDALEVESFDADGARGARGTVRGHLTYTCWGTGHVQTEWPCSGYATCEAVCTAYCEPQTVPCTIRALNCPPPSAQTCATACYSGCETCASCADTCAMTCEQFCGGTCDFQTRCWE